MGYAIQSIGLFPHWNVARNIATVPELLGWPRSRIAARVDELLTLLGLEPRLYRERWPHQLSGGQQQRVGVARALAADPELLLMDEPFGALDPITRASLAAGAARIHQSSGKTIVLVTHDIEEALRLATRIVLLDRGRIVQAGTPAQLLAQPADDFRARVLRPRPNSACACWPCSAWPSAMRAGEPADGPTPLAMHDDEPARRAVAVRAARVRDASAGGRRVGPPLGALHFSDLLAPPPAAP